MSTGSPVRFEAVGHERLLDIAQLIGTHMGFQLPPAWVDAMATFTELDTRWAALEGNRVVAGLASFAQRITVSGGAEVAAGALTVVGVLPTHRRQGHLRALMRRYLDGVHQAGQPLSILWASEGSIYGRYGYGLGTLSCELEIPRAHGQLKGTPGGAVKARLLDEGEALERLPPLYDAVRAGTPGMLARSPTWWQVRRSGDADWQRRGRQPLQRVVLEVDGQAEGYALYRHAPAIEHAAPSGRLDVFEAMAPTARGWRTVWEYLFSVDWVDRVKADFMPIDHPLYFLLQHTEQLHLRAAHGLWVRLVDVPRALAARRFGAPGSLVLEVQDELCPWNQGRWRLEEGAVTRTAESPELSLEVTALGSVYLGGFAPSQLALAGQIHERVPGALARADALFGGGRAPWCPEIF